MNAISKQIDRKVFPELDLILWDNAARYITPADAFRNYEERWPYVDQNHLSDDERRFIGQLTEEFGNGLFLTA